MTGDQDSKDDANRSTGEIIRLAKFLMEHYGGDPAFKSGDEYPEGKPTVDIAIDILKRQASDEREPSANPEDAVMHFAQFLTHTTEVDKIDAFTDCAHMFHLAIRFCEENGLPILRDGWGE